MKEVYSVALCSEIDGLDFGTTWKIFTSLHPIRCRGRRVRFRHKGLRGQVSFQVTLFS